MEVEVRNAIETLSDGDARVDPHKALWLRERLEQVDGKFKLLRKEISSLNAQLAEQKDVSDALRAKLRVVEQENIGLNNALKQKASSTKKPATKTPSKKKPTKKKS